MLKVNDFSKLNLYSGWGGERKTNKDVLSLTLMLYLEQSKAVTSSQILEFIGRPRTYHAFVTNLVDHMVSSGLVQKVKGQAREVRGARPYLYSLTDKGNQYLSDIRSFST
jgi:DNA-binding MarR family transcriptional regulator